jgi:hypothetical protein
MKLTPIYDVQIKVEDFFSFFFSDDAVSCNELFHNRCGDKGSLPSQNSYEISYLNVIFLVSLLKNMGQMFFHIFYAVNFFFAFQTFGAVRGILMKYMGMPVMCHFNIR